MTFYIPDVEDRLYIQDPENWEKEFADHAAVLSDRYNTLQPCFEAWWPAPDHEVPLLWDVEQSYSFDAVRYDVRDGTIDTLPPYKELS